MFFSECLCYEFIVTVLARDHVKYLTVLYNDIVQRSYRWQKEITFCIILWFLVLLDPIIRTIRLCIYIMCLLTYIRIRHREANKLYLSLSFSLFLLTAYGPIQSNKQSTKTKCDDQQMNQLFGVNGSN